MTVKKKISCLLIVLVMVLSSLILTETALADGEDTSPISGIPTEIELALGESATWNPQPENGRWLWDSALLDAAVDGSQITVTAKAEGTAQVTYITAQYERFAVQVTITDTNTSTRTGAGTSASSEASAVSRNTSSKASAADSASAPSVLNPAAGGGNRIAVIIGSLLLIAVSGSIMAVSRRETRR